jgi:rod shape-determining protein MreC
MSANTAQRKSHWLLAALLLIQVILMSFYAKNPESEQSILREWLMTVYTPVASGVDWVVSGVVGKVASYTDLRGAREENINLRERVDQLTAELNETREKATELDQLRRHFALPSLPAPHAVAANVIARDTNLWFSRMTIDRGTLDGVKRDMPVVTGAGVVGRVIAVGPNFAQVQVITDRLAGVGAMLQKSRAMGVVRGVEPEAPHCELKNIRATETVEIGESVVTNGLDRIYPKGLIIGEVERIESDPNAPWHRIVVKLSARVDRVEHVLVLLVEQKDLKMEELTK